MLTQSPIKHSANNPQLSRPSCLAPPAPQAPAVQGWPRPWGTAPLPALCSGAWLHCPCENFPTLHTVRACRPPPDARLLGAYSQPYAGLVPQHWPMSQPLVGSLPQPFLPVRSQHLAQGGLGTVPGLLCCAWVACLRHLAREGHGCWALRAPCVLDTSVPTRGDTQWDRGLCSPGCTVGTNASHCPCHAVPVG